jgi:hypothetical protein
MAAPRKHPPQGAAEVIKRMASEGYSAIGIAAHFKVARTTLKRWMEEDESLEEAFEQGKETERQALHALIVQSAVLNKPANANAMFLLKTKHGYREFDSPNTKVDVNVNAVQPVMIVRDHGTDEEWAVKMAEQQRKLLIDAQTPIAPQLALEAPQSAPEPVVYDEPVLAPVEAPVPPYAPAWKARS